MYNPNFMGISSIGSTLIINELENNLKSFLDWGFANAGGFVNVTRPTKNISNFDQHILKPVKDPSRNNNAVWQAPRKDWIYEHGVEFAGSSPINVSGIYVNNTFYPGPTGNATVGYKINYPEGKIYFNNSIPSSSKVEAEYSYRHIQVYKIEEFPYWKEIQYRSLENKTGFSLNDKGDFAIGSEHRVQLPAVVIETAPRANSRPYRLGDKSLIIEQDILFHILADNRSDRNNIIDILRLQEDRVIWLYKTDKVIKDGKYLLNYNGTKNSNGKNYYELVNDPTYRWIRSRFLDVNISDISFPNIRMYGSVVRITNEMIYTEFGGGIVCSSNILDLGLSSCLNCQSNILLVDINSCVTA